MGKNKNGKVNPEAVNPAPEAAEAEVDEKKGGVFLNNISEKLIKDREKTKDDGTKKALKAVSFNYGTDENGKNIMGSFVVNPGQIRESHRIGKDRKQEPNPGYKNILLGQPGKEINVSLSVKDPATGEYKNVRMPVEEIKARNEEARKVFKAAQKAGKAAPDAPAPEAEAEAELE